jgi:hypothetical protein
MAERRGFSTQKMTNVGQIGPLCLILELFDGTNF